MLWTVLLVSLGLMLFTASVLYMATSVLGDGVRSKRRGEKWLSVVIFLVSLFFVVYIDAMVFASLIDEFTRRH